MKTILVEPNVERETPWVATWFKDPDVARRRREERRGVLAEWWRRVRWRVPAGFLILALLEVALDPKLQAVTLPLAWAGAIFLLAAPAVQARDSVRHDFEAEAARGLMEDPEDPRAWPVEIGIVQDGVVSGRDRGVAWFEEDAFGFSGEATSFLITGAEADRGYRPVSQELKGIPHEWREHCLALRPPPRWHAGGRGIWLIVRLLPRPGSGIPNNRHEFGRQLKELGRKSQKRLSRGQFPPLGLGPGIRSSTSLVAEGYARAALTLVWCGVLTACAVESWRLGKGSGLFFFVLAWPWFALGFIEQVRQGRALRKIAARERARELWWPGDGP